MSAVSDYFRAIQRQHASGQATEHSYRAPLETLLRGPGNDIQVINEPKRQDFGAPDFILHRGGQPVGYVECKAPHARLDEVAEREQLRRYRQACDNLLLTNHLEFRWFRGGEPGRSVRIARLSGGQLQHLPRHNHALDGLLRDFRQATPTPVHSPGELAQVMADLTREMACLISETLAGGRQHSFLYRHKHDLEQELLPELANEEFADMYAQTLVYALFAARIQHQGPAADFTLEQAFWQLPSTNPFLRREFQEIAQNIDGEVRWAVDQLAARLALTDMDEVMAGFRSRTQQRDTIIHFYEDFLATHDPVMREQRGVYFTPEPVVGYIVRSVDALLRSRFRRPDGLADRDVHILDPAVGTGSFLVKVVEEIRESPAMRRQRGMWPGYVREHLLPRLHGFELLMAPYTLAHMRLGMALQETGFRLRGDERLGIYLTNALDRGVKREALLWQDHIKREASAAAEVKNDKPIMVVLGNPPYSGNSANRGGWIRDLLRDYYQVDGAPLGEKNPKWLQDDYVKFLRFGQWRIAQHGEGVLAFITNHGWLENPTFRGMRQSLLNSFSEIYVLDLHGNSKKKERTPEGNKDENVFDIQQGVSIALFVKQRETPGPARVFHADLWGLRDDKYAALNANDVDSLEWVESEPESPSYFFKPFDYRLWSEYGQGWKITDIFPLNSTGIVTSRDHFVLDFEEEELRKRIAEFRDLSIPDEEIRERYRLRDKKHWKLTGARTAIAAEENWERFIQPCLYRPFDTRPLYYHPKVLEGARQNMMRHMLRDSEFADNADLRYARQSDNRTIGQSDKQATGSGTSRSSAPAASSSAARGTRSSSPTAAPPSTASPSRKSTTSSRSTSGNEPGARDEPAAIPERGLGAGMGGAHPDGDLPHLQQNQRGEPSFPAVLPSSDELEHLSGRGGAKLRSSRSDRWPRGDSTTSSSARGPATSASRSATGAGPTSSRSGSGDEPGAHHDPDDEGRVGRVLHDDNLRPQVLFGLRRQLSLPPLPLRPGANVALAIGRAGQVIDGGAWNIVFCAASPTDLNLFRRGGHALFPLYRHGPGALTG